jgi:hypothetical protein
MILSGFNFQQPWKITKRAAEVLRKNDRKATFIACNASLPYRKVPTWRTPLADPQMVGPMISDPKTHRDDPAAICSFKLGKPFMESLLSAELLHQLPGPILGIKLSA